MCLASGSTSTGAISCRQTSVKMPSGEPTDRQLAMVEWRIDLTSVGDDGHLDHSEWQDRES